MGEGNPIPARWLCQRHTCSKARWTLRHRPSPSATKVLSGQNDHFGQPMFRKVTHVLHWPQLQVHVCAIHSRMATKRTRAFFHHHDRERAPVGQDWCLAGYLCVACTSLAKRCGNHGPPPRGDLSVQPGTVKTIYRTEQAGVGWIEDHTQFEIQGREGSLFQLREYSRSTHRTLCSMATSMTARTRFCALTSTTWWWKRLTAFMWAPSFWCTIFKVFFLSTTTDPLKRLE